MSQRWRCWVFYWETIITCSSERNHNTYKSLIDISPAGAITFVSDLYEGSLSNRELTSQCGLLKLLETHDSVMPDNGFDIQDLLASVSVKYNMPPKRQGEKQLTPQEIITSKKTRCSQNSCWTFNQMLKRVPISGKNNAEQSLWCCWQDCFCCSSPFQFSACLGMLSKVMARGTWF